MDIKESDWKVFRRLHSVALERYCQRVLEEVKLATACNDSYHDCYLKVYRLIQDRDKTMALAFDDLRRSTALMRLVNIINEGLLTGEELKQFSQELKAGSMQSSRYPADDKSLQPIESQRSLTRHFRRCACQAVSKWSVLEQLKT